MLKIALKTIYSGSSLFANVLAKRPSSLAGLNSVAYSSEYTHFYEYGPDNPPPTVRRNGPKNFVVRMDHVTGKRRGIPDVMDYFYRLHWGVWIRTKSNRNRDLWRKSSALKRRYKSHIFCDAEQSWMLDKMTTKDMQRRRYYIDDPYESYHEREEYLVTRRKPLPPS